MTRIAVKHGKAKRANVAIFHFLLVAMLFVSSRNEVAGCDPVRQRVGGWNFDCLLDSGCPIIGQQALAAKSSILPTANELADNRSSGILNRIGAGITCGIVESRQAWACMSRFGNAIVDLPALITENIDQQFATDDCYWNYYAHCDRWQVTFNNQLIIPHATDWAQGVIQRCRQTFLLLEFVTIENLPSGQLVSKPVVDERSITDDNDYQTVSSDRTKPPLFLTSWLPKLADPPIVVYWNSLKSIRSKHNQNGTFGLAMKLLLDQLKTASSRSEMAEVTSQ